MGIFFVLSPLAMAITTAIIGILILITRSIFVAIEIVSPFFLLAVWYVEGVGPMFFCAVAIVAFQLFRSRGRLKEVKTVTTRMTRVIRRGD